MLGAMNKLQAGLFTVLLLSGCSKKDENKDEASETAQKVEKSGEGAKKIDSDKGDKTIGLSDADAIAEAKKGAKALGKTLKRRLVGAMQEGGPEAALSACAQDAQTLTAGAAAPRLRVGRSTLRLRNPKNGEAPQWVKDWLTATGERKTEGLKGHEEVVDGTARVLVPLSASGMCLGCHGDAKSHTDKMKELLASKYPDDKAVGYENGDLRGVIWAEFDLATK